MVPVPVIGPPVDLRRSRRCDSPTPPGREGLADARYQSVARDGSPVSAAQFPFDPNSRFKEPEGDDVSFRSAPPASGSLAHGR